MKENNNDIISKQMVLDEIDQMSTVIDADGVKYIEKTCLKIRINILRPVDTIPVRYGHWIGGEIGQCSVCGHIGCASDIWNNCSQMFCPNCGANMRKDGSDNG